MRIRHNKKRNTAFVYEALIVEATAAIIKKDFERRNIIVDLIKKHFNADSVLRKELNCYRSLYENQELEKDISKRILKESRLQQKMLQANVVFESQTALIHDINKSLGSSVFGNFVSNYKTLATIAQLFSDNVSPKNQIILENQIVDNMSKTKKSSEPLLFDKKVYEIFADKFNSKYDAELLPEQKELLTHYISSFTDNALALKTFLNEEISRLKKLLIEARQAEEIEADEEMLQKTNTIIEKLNSFSKEAVGDSLLLSVLRTQSLVKEIYTDGDSS